MFIITFPNCAEPTLNVTDFRFERRKYTRSELKEIEKEWNKYPHLLSGKDYALSKKNDLITAPNKDFPHNLFLYLEIHKDETTICNNFPPELLPELKERDIPYRIILPEYELKDEWLGREVRTKISNRDLGNPRYSTYSKCDLAIFDNKWEYFRNEEYETLSAGEQIDLDEIEEERE